jgi:hypothetical protein
MIKSSIENLKQTDFYSILLFALYKMNEIPEYSSLSQMAYVLDQKNLLRFFEYFGGQTLKIPTIQEMESLIYSLLLYQYVKIDNIPYEEALNLLGHKSCELRQVKKKYNSLCQVLENYSFTP